MVVKVVVQLVSRIGVDERSSAMRYYSKLSRMIQIAHDWVPVHRTYGDEHRGSVLEFQVCKLHLALAAATKLAFLALDQGNPVRVQG